VGGTGFFAVFESASAASGSPHADGLGKSYVPDVDVVHQRAVEAGARSVQEPGDVVHGDRMATVIDPFGNQWTVASRIEQISVEELHRRLAK
jgi:uncharacterized glyoxalase superfamily protein PhnB